MGREKRRPLPIVLHARFLSPQPPYNTKHTEAPAGEGEANPPLRLRFGVCVAGVIFSQQHSIISDVCDGVVSKTIFDMIISTGNLKV